MGFKTKTRQGFGFATIWLTRCWPKITFFFRYTYNIITIKQVGEGSAFWNSTAPGRGRDGVWFYQTQSVAIPSGSTSNVSKSPRLGARWQPASPSSIKSLKNGLQVLGWNESLQMEIFTIHQHQCSKYSHLRRLDSSEMPNNGPSNYPL